MIKSQKPLFGLFVSVIIGISFLFSCVAPASAVDLTLGWDANTEKDIEGYAVYKKVGSAPTDKDLDGYVAIKDLINPAYPVYTISDLKKGSKYYLALKAYNATGTYSAFSNALCVEVGDTIGLCSDTPSGGTGGGSGGGGGGCFINSAGAPLPIGAWGAGVAALIIGGLMAIGASQKRE